MPFSVWLGAMILLLIVNVCVHWLQDKWKPQGDPQENRVVQRTPRQRYWVEGNTVHSYKM
jgi:hypothetical protein